METIFSKYQLYALNKSITHLDSNYLNVNVVFHVLRCWHYYTGESSAKILRQASAATMKRNYMMLHTMDPVVAIEDFKEISRQKHEQKQHRLGAFSTAEPVAVCLFRIDNPYDNARYHGKQCNACDCNQDFSPSV